MSRDPNEFAVPKILPDLATNHLEWLFSAAQDAFSEKIAELELDSIRHTTLMEDEKFYSKGMHRPRKRKDKLERNTTFIEQYTKIVEYCAVVRELLLEKGSKEFAKHVIGGMGIKPKRAPRKRTARNGKA